MTTTLALLEISKIRIDGDTQVRVTVDEDVVTDYAEHYENGLALPPVIVFHDGADYWLVDGFHRLHARRRLKYDNIETQIHRGTREEARWAACAANRNHGLRRTNADKRKAVQLALEVRPDAADRLIAEHVGVDHKTVAAVRGESGGEVPQPRKGRDGKTYKAPPPPEKKRSAPPPAEDPEPEAMEVIDGLKRKVTESRAIAAFARAPEFNRLVNVAHGLRRSLAELAEVPQVGRELAKRLQQAEADCKNLVTLIRFCAPFTECPMGDNCGANCRLCEGQKWITEDQYNALEDGLKKRLKKGK